MKNGSFALKSFTCHQNHNNFELTRFEHKNYLVNISSTRKTTSLFRASEPLNARQTTRRKIQIDKTPKIQSVCSKII